MGHLGKLFPMSTSARAMVWAHCGCFCRLLNKQLGCLSILVPDILTPHPLIHDTCDIIGVFKNQLFQLRSCQLYSCNASYKTGVLLVQIWCGFSELQCLEYFKLGFLEIQNVTIQSVFYKSSHIYIASTDSNIANVDSL